MSENEKIERRFLSLEVRAASEDGKMYVEGDAAVFNQETVIGNWFREMVKPGAFKRVLSEKPDVIAAYNHDWSIVLARTTNGTLTLEETPSGLKYRAEINPNDQQAVSVYEKVKRGDVPQASFAFSVRAETWVNPDSKGNLALRVIDEVDQLYDVGPCTFGAYPQASAQARSMADSYLQDPNQDPNSDLQQDPQDGQEPDPVAEDDGVDMQEPIDMICLELTLLKLKFPKL